MWEDAQNKNGGRWLVNLNKNQRMTELDNFWLETVSTNYTEKFLNFGMPEIFAVIYLKFKQRGQTLEYLSKKKMRME